jgi:ribonuclease H2 subunit A
MVYGCFYLPISLSTSLLSSTHRFDDSKVLTPSFRAELMEKLCTPPSPPSDPASPNPASLYDNCGWAVDVLSARSISAGMLRPVATYNLNAQAMDSTIALIQSVYALGVNVKEIYIDTIGQPAAYQKKLERIFPTANITVAKKADSLYPCVSAASVAAKVTRDVALEVLYSAYSNPSPPLSLSPPESKSNGEHGDEEEGQDVEMVEAPAQAEEPSWGSGYPSDARCTTWLKRNIDPVFGWGTECRFSWGTAKDLLDNKSLAAQVMWPVENEDADNARLTDFFAAEGDEKGKEGELGAWFGGRVNVEAF